MVVAVDPVFATSYGGVWISTYHAGKGQGLPQHSHAYEHLTQCHAGRCAIRKEGRELVITKNSSPINLTAEEWHEIEALEDGTVFVNTFKL